MISWKHTIAIATSGATIAVMLVGQTTNPPAPTVDRVGFPTNYQNAMDVLYVYDRPDNKQVRTVYANAPVFTVTNANQNNYPYSSVVVMETWSALKGNNIFDRPLRGWYAGCGGRDMLNALLAHGDLDGRGDSQRRQGGNCTF